MLLHNLDNLESENSILYNIIKEKDDTIKNLQKINNKILNKQ